MDKDDWFKKLLKEPELINTKEYQTQAENVAEWLAKEYKKYPVKRKKIVEILRKTEVEEICLFMFLKIKKEFKRELAYINSLKNIATTKKSKEYFEKRKQKHYKKKKKKEFSKWNTMRIHTNLKRIYEKIKRENDTEPYQVLLEKFVTLLTYEDTYLGKLRGKQVYLEMNREDMFIECGGFGILISPKDEISIHT